MRSLLPLCCLPVAAVSTGKRLVECIKEGKKWPKSLPRIESDEVAIAVGNALIAASFFHRSEKVAEKKGYLKFSQGNFFEEKGYYTWMYAGNMMWSNIGTGIVIALVIGFTLLPIWPDAAKKILWYCSVTFLIATFAFCLIRLLAFAIMWIFGYDFWIFPRLFDETLSVQDSFKPVVSLEKGSTGQGIYRVGLLLAFASFIYWATTQPTEFDGFIAAQKEFIDDLYSGKLIADVAFDPKDKMPGRKVPTLEDLLKELEADERISDTAENPDMDGDGRDSRRGEEEYVHLSQEHDKEAEEEEEVDEGQELSDSLGEEEGEEEDLSE